MKRALLIAPILSLFPVLPSHALEFGGGFFVTGKAELELFGDRSDTELLGYSSVDLGYEQPGGGLGGFVGVDAFGMDGDSEAAFYGALSFSGSFGKFQAGAPRPVLEDYIGTPALGGSALFEVLDGPYDGSLLTTLALLNGFETPLGLRYDGDFGAAKVGASWHVSEETDFVDLAVNYDLGQATLRAGLEHFSGPGQDGTSYYLGAEAKLGQFTTGVLVSNLDDLLTKGAKIYGTFQPIDNLDVTGVIFHHDDNGDNFTDYSLDAAYSFGEGPYVKGGIIDGSDRPTALSLSAGVKF